MSIFFILGAGASVDSGLPTYRGPEGYYEKNYEEITQLISVKTLDKSPEKIWDFFNSLYTQVQKSKPGPTYQLINKLCEKYPESFVLTQNIDGIASKHLSVPVVEMHGNINYMVCEKCDKQDMNYSNPVCKCGEKCIPDIVLFGQDLDRQNIMKMYTLIKKHKPKYVFMIGTTMQFGYLREFIEKSRTMKCNRYHINPDKAYVFDGNMNKGEKLVQMKASEGLQKIIDENILENDEYKNITVIKNKEDEKSKIKINN
jgi:NAD-dependent protein deacetylase/lipoamidase